jgi:hypothetical protein
MMAAQVKMEVTIGIIRYAQTEFRETISKQVGDLDAEIQDQET